MPEGEALVGDDGVRWVKRLCSGERYYVATERGVLWEYSARLAEFCGMIAFADGDAKRACADISSDGERLFVRLDCGETFSVALGDRERFRAIGSFTPPNRRSETSLAGEALEDVPFTTRTSKEGLWVRFI